MKGIFAISQDWIFATVLLLIYFISGTLYTGKIDESFANYFLKTKAKSNHFIVLKFTCHRLQKKDKCDRQVKSKARRCITLKHRPSLEIWITVSFLVLR